MGYSYPRVGIGVLIFNSSNQLLLGKRINVHGSNTWGPAGGHLEWGKTFEACAVRETYEETGLEVVNPQLVGVTNDVFENEEKHYVSIFMKVVCSSTQVVVNKEPHKIDEWKWFDIEQLPENLFLPLNHFLMQKNALLIGLSRSLLLNL